MRTRPGRFLAPLALLACAAAVLATIQISLGEDDRATPARGQQAGPTRAADAARRDRPVRRRSYTVRRGDVLSDIAARTGVSVDDIVRLNPGVDPQSLRVGLRLRLRR